MSDSALLTSLDRPCFPSPSIHRVNVPRVILAFDTQASPAETGSRPIAELLARVQRAVAGHLFDVTKAMTVALDQSGTDSLCREDFRRVCGRYVGLSPHQVRTWSFRSGGTPRAP